MKLKAAIQQNDINKLREIVGNLKMRPRPQAQAGQQAARRPAPIRIRMLRMLPNSGASTEGQEGGPDDVVDADFTDKKK
jgi:hypothetical protein